MTGILLSLPQLAFSASPIPALGQPEPSDRINVATDPPAVVKETREEAAKPTVGPTGRPLPLFCCWHMQCYAGDKFNQPYQIELIKQGHHLLPWMRFGEWDTSHDMFEGPFRTYAKWRIPVSFSGQNFEYPLQLERLKKWAVLPAAQNPGTLLQNGEISHRLSPFAPARPWEELGRYLVSCPQMKALQSYYPDPPRVIIVNNNEATKLEWRKAPASVNESKRYTDRYGFNTSKANMKKAVVDGWMRCYASMVKGMHAGLTPRWDKVTQIVGYNAFSDDHLGRWDAWTDYSLYVPGMWEKYILGTYEGSSPEWYDNQWEARKRDYLAWSVQIEMMNLVFMQQRICQLDPNYWFELSVWDGDRRHNQGVVGKPDMYRNSGQQWPAARYAGSTQFGLWLLRPRAIRLYVERAYSRSGYQPEFDAHLRIVDNIYTNPLFIRFWRFGKLVPNRAHQHLFRHNVPEEYRDEDRWFLLDCDAHPAWPWQTGESKTVVDVFPIALVIGKPGAREWLLYLHSPRGDRSDVTVEIPNYGKVRVDSTVGGAFYHVTEQGHRVSRVLPGEMSVWQSSTASKLDGRTISGEQNDVTNQNQDTTPSVSRGSPLPAKRGIGTRLLIDDCGMSIAECR